MPVPVAASTFRQGDRTGLSFVATAPSAGLACRQYWQHAGRGAVCSSRLLRGHLLSHLVPAVTCPNVSWDPVDSRRWLVIGFCIANRCTLCEQKCDFE